jgi:hypothetical protein
MSELRLRECHVVRPRNAAEWRALLVDLLATALAAYLREASQRAGESEASVPVSAELMSRRTRGKG